MKTINLLAAATALVMAATPAFAVNWIYVTETTTNTRLYYDLDTIQRSGNQVIAWEKWDHSRDKSTKERETKWRSRFDCSERTSTLLNATFYYPDGKIESFTLETYERKVEPAIPGTTGETMLETVCVMPADANAIP